MSKSSQVLTSPDVRSFFKDSVSQAMDTQGLQAREDTVAYLINLLSDFARTDRLYEWTADGYMLRPLADLYGDAIYASNREVRDQSLRRLGDVALFVAGLFAENLQQRAVGLDYYIAMGGTAYSCLSDQCMSISQRPVFEELSKQFTDFVEVLSQVVERGVADDKDILRIYDRWLRTGNRYHARRLRELGIDVINIPQTSRH